MRGAFADRMYRAGLAVTPLRRELLVGLWHRARIVVGVVFVVTGITLTAAWDWPAGLLVASFGGIAGADSAAQIRRGNTQPPTFGILYDITAVHIGAGIAGIPDAALGIPFAYLIVTVTVLVPLRWAIGCVVYGGVWFFAISSGVVMPWSELGTGQIVLMGVLLDLVYAMGLLLLITAMIRIINVETTRRSQHLRLQRGLTSASTSLIATAGSEPLRHAMQAMLSATDASSVFVLKNVIVPELGLCSVRHESVSIEGGVTAGDRLGGKPVPWHGSQSRELFEDGRTVLTEMPRRSGRRVGQQLARPSCRLDVPIFVDDEWWGILGFLGIQGTRKEIEKYLELLVTAADMIGSYLERLRVRLELEQLIRSKDEFVAAVSHELRTPLTAVVGLSAELKHRFHDFDEITQLELVGLIAEQSAELSDMVDDLLVAARADIGTMVLTPEPVELLAQVAAVLRGRVDPRAKAIEVGGDEVEMRADPVRLRQILRNLIVNAQRYGGAKVKIEVAATTDSAVVSIADDGVGVAPEDIETIFDPYGTSRLSTTHPAPVGLGLSVARHLARQMGGDVVYSRRDDWTRFTLSLPRGLGGSDPEVRLRSSATEV